jgi:nucleotide-binding universal stress UspA family protein
MIRHILVATDFSTTAERAARFAAELAQQVGARITLLSVYSLAVLTTPEAVYVPTEDEELARAEADLDRLQTIAAGIVPAGVQFSCKVLAGEPAPTIVRAASEEHADLIVMGTHGRRGVRRLLLGSVAESVVRTAFCPVVTIGHQVEAAPHAFAV